jgi:hypothetical protein
MKHVTYIHTRIYTCMHTRYIHTPGVSSPRSAVFWRWNKLHTHTHTYIRYIIHAYIRQVPPHLARRCFEDETCYQDGGRGIETLIEHELQAECEDVLLSEFASAGALAHSVSYNNLDIYCKLMIFVCMCVCVCVCLWVWGCVAFWVCRCRQSVRMCCFLSLPVQAHLHTQSATVIWICTIRYIHVMYTYTCIHAFS